MPTLAMPAIQAILCQCILLRVEASVFDKHVIGSGTGIHEAQTGRRLIRKEAEPQERQAEWQEAFLKQQQLTDAKWLQGPHRLINVSAVPLAAFALGALSQQQQQTQRQQHQRQQPPPPPLPSPAAAGSATQTPVISVVGPAAAAGAGTQGTVAVNTAASSSAASPQTKTAPIAAPARGDAAPMAAATPAGTRGPAVAGVTSGSTGPPGNKAASVGSAPVQGMADQPVGTQAVNSTATDTQVDDNWNVVVLFVVPGLLVLCCCAALMAAMQLGGKKSNAAPVRAKTSSADTGEDRSGDEDGSFKPKPSNGGSSYRERRSLGRLRGNGGGDASPSPARPADDSGAVASAPQAGGYRDRRRAAKEQEGGDTM